MDKQVKEHDLYNQYGEQHQHETNISLHVQRKSLVLAVSNYDKSVGIMVDPSCHQKLKQSPIFA
jgi:hypothetical protein